MSGVAAPRRSFADVQRRCSRGQRAGLIHEIWGTARRPLMRARMPPGADLLTPRRIIYCASAVNVNTQTGNAAEGRTLWVVEYYCGCWAYRFPSSCFLPCVRTKAARS
jgi:hypothetical protein